MLFRFIALVGAIASLGYSLPATAEKLAPERSVQSEDNVRIEVVDLTPRFLAFYEAAKDVADPDARHALWKDHYGFAAVPPGPRGEAMARQLLDEAWPKYEAHLPELRGGAAVFEDLPIHTLRAVARVLDATQPIAIRLVAYVGGFENNAFAAGIDGTPVVNFPVEMPAEQRRLTMAHEFTHAVHMQLANSSGGWERSIGTTLIQEGLAMHVAREVVPGGPVTYYVEHEAGWWSQANERREAILAGIEPALESKDPETVFRFTIGTGPARLEREAYATGWWVIDHLRKNGMTLAEIARVPEDQMPALARRAIAQMLAQ